MKHIEKRFLYQSKTETNQFFGDQFEFDEISKGYSSDNLKDRIGRLVYIQTSKGVSIGGFVCKVDGTPIILPIPDLSLIYFNNAQAMVKNIYSTRKDLLNKLDFNETFAEPAKNDIYGFIGSVSIFVISLFTSMESFINQRIPDEFIYQNVTKRKTELYNKSQIQENLDFKTKMTKVLKEVTGKDFFSKPTQANQLIWNLKDFRDDIVHTKQEESPNKYGELLKLYLNFKYGKSLEAVAKFMNFYKMDYIVECGCGADH